MIKLTFEEWTEQVRAQGVPREHLAVVCPMCKTVQSATSFKLAEAEPGAIETQLGFSCVGRWTNAGPPRKKPDGKPCNWSLGGLFQLHECEVTKDGKVVKTFRPATPEEAQALMRQHEKEKEQ